MILGYTQEDPAKIQSFIKETIDIMDLSKLGQYEKFYCMVPTKFSLVTRMMQIKFTELFGRMIARDVETHENTKHATTVVKSNELFLSFGKEDTLWGDEGHRLSIPLPEWANYGTMIAVAYYVIGKIQKSQHPYFKERIVEYTDEISKVFGETISPIID